MLTLDNQITSAVNRNVDNEHNRLFFVLKGKIYIC